LVGKALDGSWICKRLEEFPDGVLLAGQPESRADFGEGLEYKTTQVQARVRDDDGGCRKGQVPSVKNVQINDARRIARPLGGASHGGLDFLERFEQGGGKTVVSDFNDSVQKTAGVRLRADGLCLVKAGSQAWSRDALDLEDRFPCPYQGVKAIPDI
jgi:hypothetical protein